jgi:NAD-dependent SIR2 family protein deacetylase
LKVKAVFFNVTDDDVLHCSGCNTIGSFHRTGIGLWGMFLLSSHLEYKYIISSNFLTDDIIIVIGISCKVQRNCNCPHIVAHTARRKKSGNRG